MRKLVLLVGVVVILALGPLPWSTPSIAGMIPSWENEAKTIGFWPIANEVSYFFNRDDLGTNRGRTLQIVSINAFRLVTDFSFEFTADYNYRLTPGYNEDHYVELSLVKPVCSYLSVNVQRIYAKFEPTPVNQVGVRLSL